jgi:NADH-quinone oxidoreductase subunit F|tara:strand:- start:192 stop:1295 length:1104 start_codon:yes stop_codon:yes gene_type:complete
MKILQKSELKAWKKAKKLGPKKTIQLLKKQGLTGRGGACFLTGLKWELVKNAKGNKFIICNADEGEPGTFKDKLLLEKNPENIIEGILIAAYCINTKQAYIYLRGEYNYLKDSLKKTIEETLTASRSSLKIDIIQGAGAYICGDETAIIASIENKRGYPHFKPPYPPQKGLFGKPTVINNVETLANVPLAIINKDWNDSLRLFSISGNVSKPRVYEIKVGTKLGKIALLAKAKNIKAVCFGASGGCIPYNSNSIINAEHICKEEAMLGACSLIFINKKKSMLDLAINIAQFFNHESCGKCTPCREGNTHILKLLEKIKSGKAKQEDIELLEKLSITIRDTALCGLGQSCTNHILTALNHFKKDFKVR